MDMDSTGRNSNIHAPEWDEGRMYAICFDLLQEALDKYYSGGDIRNAYGDVRRVLEARGFWNQQGSVYFSNHKRAMAVWEAVAELQEKFDWFAKCVRDLKMLRIEENNDLMPLLNRPILPMDLPKFPRPSRPRSGAPANLN